MHKFTKIYLLWHQNYFFFFIHLQATRAKYQHGKLKNTQVKNTAMNEVKDRMRAIVFEGEDFKNPIAYAFMYIQWEANIVSN